ncbi:hypothetical protein BH24DEI2_BH24DEI2_29080 [soil metagenome]
MEKTYRLTIHVDITLADQPDPATDWDDEPDRVEVEARVIETLKNNDDLRTVLFQLRSLRQAERILDELVEETERDLASLDLGADERVAKALKAVAVDGYEADLLLETTARGLLEELEDWQ